MDRLTHVDESGAARMVDVGDKPVTARTASATGRVLVSPTVVELLRGEGVMSQWVVIPEGKTVSQVAEILDQHRLASAGKFMRAAHRSPKAYGFAFAIPRRSLEGYLMPDSYS